MINIQVIEVVSSQKLLNTYIQSSCKWDNNISYLIKKVWKRVYCLRVLKTYGVNKKILKSTYRFIIESILSNSIMGYRGALIQYL